MRDPSKDVRPRDKALDQRTVLAGVAIFLMLATFSAIGFVLTSRSPGSANTNDMGSAPQTSSARSMPPPVPAPPQPKLDVRVTEHPEATAKTDQPQDGQSQPNGVVQDDQGLTVTLDPSQTPSSDATPPDPSANPDPGPKPDASEKPKKTPAAVVPEPMPMHPKSAADADRKRPSTSGGRELFRVQVGTFANKSNADSLVENLRDHGYRPEVKTMQVEARTTFRVQLGAYKTRDDADELSKDLAAEGYSPRVFSEK